jgi:hypothetical protein
MQYTGRLPRRGAALLEVSCRRYFGHHKGRRGLSALHQDEKPANEYAEQFGTGVARMFPPIVLR